MDHAPAFADATTTAPPLGDVPPQLLGRSVAELTRRAAEVLGATPESALRIAEQCLLTVDGMGVGIVPVIADAGGRPGLLITVVTGRKPTSAEDALAPLRHAPGLLVSFGATLGRAEDGAWTLMRALPLQGTTPRTLAEQIVVTRELVGMVWPAATH